MFKKQLLIVLLLIGFMATADAQVELNPSHPDTYVVQKGDTLWDISATFLKSPWLWPEIWHVNPQIENPHLIYPGDVLSLVYLDGQPKITVSRGHPTVKLGPEVRTIDHDEAIRTIPLGDIEPFLKKLRILSKEEIDAAPYIVAAEEDRYMAAPSDNVYVRNLSNVQQGDLLAVVRPTVVYREVPVDFPWYKSENRRVDSQPWAKTSDYTGDKVAQRFWRNFLAQAYWKHVRILGYEVAEIGVAEVVRVGTDDITTIELKEATWEVKKGDLVLPLDDFRFDPYFTPKAATLDHPNVRVVALNNALFGSGKRQIVAISTGAADDVAVGDVFAAYRPEKVIRDEVMYPKGEMKTLFKPGDAMVTLPEEFVGNIMVFKTFDHISYAIIMSGNRPVKLFDYVRLP